MTIRLWSKKALSMQGATMQSNSRPGMRLGRFRALAGSTAIALLASVSLPAVAAACEGGGGFANFAINASPTKLKGASETLLAVTNISGKEATVKKISESDPGLEFSWNGTEVLGCARKYASSEQCTWKVKYKGGKKDTITWTVEDENGKTESAAVTGEP